MKHPLASADTGTCDVGNANKGESMFKIFGRVVGLFRALSAPKRPLLEGLVAAVFVREANGSRTHLEHYLEQELIVRGARMVIANQQAGMSLVKQGDFLPLHHDAHFVLIGTLAIRSGLTRQEREYTESEYDYAVREEAHRVAVRSLALSMEPMPVLKGREFKWVTVPVLHYQFSFRLIGNDGSILASGTCEKFPRANSGSYEQTLRNLARDAIYHLNQTDVWSRVII